VANVPGATDRQLPGRAGRWLGGRGLTTILAAATVLMLAGVTARGASSVSTAYDPSAYLGTQAGVALGADGMVGQRSPHHDPAPGQRAIPGALPAVPSFAVFAAVLLGIVFWAGSWPPVARLRLPLRRGPPRDAFPR
jgi:hypothetical protein